MADRGPTRVQYPHTETGSQTKTDSVILPPTASQLRGVPAGPARMRSDQFEEPMMAEGQPAAAAVIFPSVTLAFLELEPIFAFIYLITRRAGKEKRWALRARLHKCQDSEYVQTNFIKLCSYFPTA